ncbi:glycoside hydrolase family 16 protein [Mangrovibacterium lignilyticum]|uniref:glycoside hydrolase family 16 protein n=1 Tax=Mangrovibacterium lignilyticum TaxID=2668052 RepID=UPI0013D7E0BC|nr:glycoside hydrolase family 16 protein [Mangrovibacterium lignilyticum]
MKKVIHRFRCPKMPFPVNVCLPVFILVFLFNMNPSSANPVEEPVRIKADQTDSAMKDGMVLVWSDEFNKDGAPDPANWNYEYGFVRNQELQWYQSQNAICKNGVLVIEGKRETVDNPNYSPVSSDWRNIRESAAYTSSCLITRGLQEWPAGGYYEVRARIDVTKGAWPAIWLLGTDGSWPDNGEIDMMEFYRMNDEPHLLANVAWGTAQKYKAAWDSTKKLYTDFTSKDPDWASKFHTWSMMWDNNYIRLYLDGDLLNEVDLSKTRNADERNPFVGSQKFYLLLNLAIGSNGGIPDDPEFPITFEIDYARVYQVVKNKLK